MRSFQSFLVSLFIIILSCISFVYADTGDQSAINNHNLCRNADSGVQSASDYLCRDQDGLNCHDSLPIVEGMHLYDEIQYKQSSGLYGDLKTKCCNSTGGGDYLFFCNEPILVQEISDYRSSKLNHLRKQLIAIDEKYGTKYEARLIHATPGDSIHQAIFWLLYDDAYDIYPESDQLLQRYAIAALYFGLGGSLRWKTCWFGKRYDK